MSEDLNSQVSKLIAIYDEKLNLYNFSKEVEDFMNKLSNIMVLLNI